jgi:3-hydroxybutyryl-CoA dehydratase
MVGMIMSLKVGDIITFERTFTVRDVELFTEI